MKAELKKICWRSALVFLETVTVVFAVIALIAGILLWRLTASPLQIPFAQPAIEKALRNEERGIYAKMDSVALHWPDLRGPLYLGLINARVYGDDGHEIVSVSEAGLALSKSALLTGRIAPTSIILRKPVLQVVRDEQGNINIGFGSTDRADEQTALMNRILEYVSRPGDEGENTPLATLRAFEIQEAAVTIEDRMLDVSWSIPRFDGAFLSTESGLKSSLALMLPEWEGKSGTVKADLNYGWDEKTSDLRAEVQGFDLAMLGEKFPQAAVLAQQNITADMKITATLDSDFKPVEARVDVSSVQGAVSVKELSAEPLPYSDMSFTAMYEGAAQSLQLANAKMTAKGVTFQGSADLTRSEEGKVTGPVAVWIDELAHAQIDPLWPAAFRGDNAETWIVHRMADGILRDVKVSLKLEAQEAEEGWSFDAQNTVVDFAFENLTANYRAPLWPVTKGQGKGSFDVDQDSLVIDVTDGMIGDLDVQAAKLVFTEIVAEGKGMAIIDVKLSGPLRNVFGYIEEEPLAIVHGFDKEAVKGNAALHVKLEFPANEDVKTEEIKFDITGTANDVTLPDVVQGLALSGGPFEITVKGNEAVVAGKGKLAGRDIDVRWQEFIESEGQKYTSQINAKLVTNEALRMEFGIDLSDFIEGNVPVDVTYTEYKDGIAEAYVSADMTPARFFVAPFQYEKAVGLGGGAKAKAVLKNGELVRIENLIANAPSFRLEDTTLIFEGTGKNTSLRSGEISRFTLGQTVAKAEFENVPAQGGAPAKMKIGLTGPFLDMRPFLSPQESDAAGEEEYNEDPLELSIAADQLRTSDDDVIQYGKIYADIDAKGGFNQLEFDAIAGTVAVTEEDKAGGQNATGAMRTKPAEIYLRYKVDEQGMRTFRLEADDAGAALKAFQVYDNIRGGRLVVYAEPIRGVYDRNLVGTAEITDFRVVKAPGLARLLGALSLPGMIELLGNEGVAFSKLESQFEWRYRPQGGLLILKEGRTSGNSLGLTFDGVVDNPAGTINVSGTLVPISGVNNILSSIPLIGDILTGGSGGVFAATYSVKGQLEEPDISVNPLSVLAPGILRRILFE